MIRYAALALLFFANQATSAPAEDHWGVAPSPEFLHAAAQIEAKEYAQALPLLQTLAVADPGNADVHNLLGLAYRKTDDLDQAEGAYLRALRLNPDHIGALAYQGELFLMLGYATAAEANLAKLAVLCSDGCAEREELADAIAAWKSARD